MLDDTEENLDAVRDLSGPERDQVIADLEAELERLELAYDRLTGASDAADAVLVAPDPAGEVRLQASWSANEVVVWAGGPDTVPAVPRRACPTASRASAAPPWAGTSTGASRCPRATGRRRCRSPWPTPSAGWWPSAAVSAATASGPA